MSHVHEPQPPIHPNLDRRLWISFLLNSAISLGELLGGLFSGSLALLSDSAHNFGDVVALLLTISARRIGRLPATSRHTYGFKRAEVIAATTNAVVLFVIAALITREVIQRLCQPHPPSQGIMLTVALLALAANAGSVLLLRRHDRDDVNVRSSFLHMIQDTLSSLAVVMAALFARTAAGPWLDPFTALAIGFLIFFGAFRLLRMTFSTLLEGVPHDMDSGEVAKDVALVFPGIHIHHVHLWENGPGQRLFTAHVVVNPKTDASAVAGLIKSLKTYLHEKWGIQHVTLEPEVETCENPKTFFA